MILAKWGGSLLTNKGGPGAPRFQAALARRLAVEWAQALQGRPGVVVHGAGSFGHRQVARWRIGARRLGARDLREAILEVGGGIERLQTGVVNALRDAGVAAVAVPTRTHSAVRDGRVRFRPAPFLELLDHGFTPVTGGDLVFDDRQGASVLSGDDILVHLARALDAKRAVFATDVDGVRLDGRWLLELPPAAVRKVLHRIDRGADATGGMRGKLEAAAKLQRLGVETWIVNGRRTGRLASAIGGRPGAGTCLPANRPI